MEELHLCESVASGAFPPFLNPPSPPQNHMYLFVQDTSLVSGKVLLAFLLYKDLSVIIWCYVMNVTFFTCLQELHTYI